MISKHVVIEDSYVDIVLKLKNRVKRRLKKKDLFEIAKQSLDKSRLHFLKEKRIFEDEILKYHETIQKIGFTINNQQYIKSINALKEANKTQYPQYNNLELMKDDENQGLSVFQTIKNEFQNFYGFCKWIILNFNFKTFDFLEYSTYSLYSIFTREYFTKKTVHPIRNVFINIEILRNGENRDNLNWLNIINPQFSSTKNTGKIYLCIKGSRYCTLTSTLLQVITKNSSKIRDLELKEIRYDDLGNTLMINFIKTMYLKHLILWDIYWKWDETMDKVTDFFANINAKHVKVRCRNYQITKEAMDKIGNGLLMNKNIKEFAILFNGNYLDYFYENYLSKCNNLERLDLKFRNNSIIFGLDCFENFIGSFNSINKNIKALNFINGCFFDHKMLEQLSSLNFKSIEDCFLSINFEYPKKDLFLKKKLIAKIVEKSLSDNPNIKIDLEIQFMKRKEERMLLLRLKHKLKIGYFPFANEVEPVVEKRKFFQRIPEIKKKEPEIIEILDSDEEDDDEIILLDDSD